MEKGGADLTFRLASFLKSKWRKVVESVVDLMQAKKRGVSRYRTASVRTEIQNARCDAPGVGVKQV